MIPTESFWWAAKTDPSMHQRLSTESTKHSNGMHAAFQSGAIFDIAPHEKVFECKYNWELITDLPLRHTPRGVSRQKQGDHSIYSQGSSLHTNTCACHRQTFASTAHIASTKRGANTPTITGIYQHSNNPHMDSLTGPLTYVVGKLRRPSNTKFANAAISNMPPLQKTYFTIYP